MKGGIFPSWGIFPRDVEVDGQQWVAVAACCIQNSSTDLEGLVLFMSTLLL